MWKSIKERIKAGEFKNKADYPVKIKPPTGHNKTIEDIVKEAPKGSEIEVLTQVYKEYINYLIELEEYKNKLDTWQRGEEGAILAFRKAMEQEYNVLNHPKAETLWIIAWDKSRSSGLNEVASEYYSLVDLIK